MVNCKGRDKEKQMESYTERSGVRGRKVKLEIKKNRKKGYICE